MASTLKYKDLLTGNIMTVNHDPNEPVEITVPNGNTDWQLKTADPVHGTNTTNWVGNIPKPKN